MALEESSGRIGRIRNYFNWGEKANNPGRLSKIKTEHPFEKCIYCHYCYFMHLIIIHSYMKIFLHSNSVYYEHTFRSIVWFKFILEYSAIGLFQVFHYPIVNYHTTSEYCSPIEYEDVDYHFSWEKKVFRHWRVSIQFSFVLWYIVLSTKQL